MLWLKWIHVSQKKASLTHCYISRSDRPFNFFACFAWLCLRWHHSEELHKCYTSSALRGGLRAPLPPFFAKDGHESVDRLLAEPLLCRGRRKEREQGLRCAWLPPCCLGLALEMHVISTTTTTAATTTSTTSITTQLAQVPDACASSPTQALF